jgi:hypothetical protein
MNAAPTQAQGADTAKLVVAVGALGIGAFLAYKYWYLPNKMRDDLARYIASTGRPPQDALAALGQMGCQAYGAKYGIPPQASGGICNELAGAASQLVQQFPQLLNNTGMALGNTVSYLGQGAGNLLTSVGQGAGSLLYDVGSGAGGGIQNLSSGVAGGATAIGMVPVNIVGGTLGKVYGGVKTVVKDITKGIEHVFGSIF